MAAKESVIKKQRVLGTVLILFYLMAPIHSANAQSQQKSIGDFLAHAPAVSCKEALLLAEQYVNEQHVNVSDKYLDSIRLVYSEDYNDGKAWIVTWKNILPTDGGEIFIIVGMDKKLKHIKGR